MFQLNRDIFTSWLRWYWSLEERISKLQSESDTNSWIYWKLKPSLSKVSLSRWVSAVWGFDSTEIQSMFFCFAATVNLHKSKCSYLSGAVLDILSPALVPVSQQLNGGCGCAEPQQLWSLLIQETVIIKQVLVQHGSEENMEGRWSVFHLFTHYLEKQYR